MEATQVVLVDEDDQNYVFENSSGESLQVKKNNLMGTSALSADGQLFLTKHGFNSYVVSAT